MTHDIVSLVVGIGVSAVVLAFGFKVAWLMVTGRIDLSSLLNEPLPADAPPGTRPKASLSRFQFLVFTFVIAGLYLVLSLKAGTYVDVPNGTLILLGISGGSFVASKVAGSPATTPPATDGQVKG